MKAVFFGIGMIAAVNHGALAAQDFAIPPQAKTIIDDNHESARADCRDLGGALRIKSHVLTSAELNGDGVADFLVDDSAYLCSASASMFCGTAGCSVSAVVSSGTGFREVPFAVTHGFTVIPATNGATLRVEVAGNHCGMKIKVCYRYWRLIGDKFQVFSTLAAAQSARQSASVTNSSPSAALIPKPTPTSLLHGFRAMQLANGMRVAALNGTGPMRTLSVGCRGATPTMLLATIAQMRATEVVIRTPTRAFVAKPTAQTRPDLWEFRLADQALYRVLTSPEAGFSVSVGGVDAGSYSLANTDAVRSVLSPCAAALNEPTVAVAEQSSSDDASVSMVPIGVMGIPIRQGYYVATFERCDSAVHVFRMDQNGHAEGFDGDGTGLTFIKWKRASKKRDGSYDVEYALLPGEMKGDEIVIRIKPLTMDQFELTIQDTVRLRRCEASQVPAWARQ